jgi:sugar lactone lactonase YvrE
VVATATGDVVASDWRGGVSIVRSDGGRVERRLALNSPIPLRPNGISFTAARSLLIAQLGDCGGVWTLAPDGTLSPFLTEIEGAPLPPTNFAIEDECHRTWISVSTRRHPRQLAWRSDVADGFVACVTHGSARIVADGLHYANEVRLDPSGRFLYAVETFGRRLIRYPVAAGGALGASETVVQFEYGFFPDGFAFDVEGSIWVTSLVSNRVVRVRADGAIDTILAEVNDAFVEAVETAFAAGMMATEHLGRIPGTTLQHVTSLSFGDGDRRTVFLGSLHGECIHRFRSPVPGVPAPFSDAAP